MKGNMTRKDLETTLSVPDSPDCEEPDQEMEGMHENCPEEGSSSNSFLFKMSSRSNDNNIAFASLVSLLQNCFKFINFTKICGSISISKKNDLSSGRQDS